MIKGVESGTKRVDASQDDYPLRDWFRVRVRRSIPRNLSKPVKGSNQVVDLLYPSARLYLRLQVDNMDHITV